MHVNSTTATLNPQQSYPCPNHVPVAPGAASNAVCDLPGSLRARGNNNTSVCRSLEVHPGRHMHIPKRACAPMSKPPPQHPLGGPVASSIVRASNGMSTVQRCSPIRLQDDQRHCSRRVGGRDV